MHKIGALLLLILLIILIIFVDFKDEDPDTTPIPMEDTTEVFTKKDGVRQEDNQFKIEKQQNELTDTPSKKEVSVSEKTPEIFTLLNTKAESHNVTVSGQKVIFQNMAQPIVIINLFATWCPPCIGEIPYLNDLQKKHHEELYVMGILTHDSIVQDDLETFMAKNQINYFIANGIQNDTFANLLATTLDLPKNFPIPLTVMYLEGEYFTHYEGSVPVEMIEYDIQQAKKQLKSR